MKKLRQYNDSLFAICMILALIIGAGVLWSQWQVIRTYWKTNFERFSVSPDDIVSGGTGRDNGIVPIDAPVFVHVSTALILFEDYDPVIVVDYYGVERAYPLTILTLHEIVNDTIDDVAIAVTFCPLCNSAMVYHREVDGRVLRMGVSGNFYGNNFLMYDDLTESWWYQFTGEALVGDFTGETLDIIPSQVVGFRTYAERYPDGVILTGDANNPGINYNITPYENYQNAQSPILSHDEYDPRLGAMARVLSMQINDTPIAYPFDILQEVGVVNDTVNGNAVVVFWQPGIAGDSNSETIGQAATFGREVRGEILTFRYENGYIFDNETGSEWNIFGEAISGELEGETLYDYQCFTHFWFAWSSAHPETLVYGQ